MHQTTRLKFNDYLNQVAKLNNVSGVDKVFNVAPNVQQAIEKHIQEAAPLLKKINVNFPANQQGQKIGVGFSGTIASRTNTNTKDRAGVFNGALNAVNYFCHQTNYDTVITYAQLDAWNHEPKFQLYIRDLIAQQVALDRLMIGFNGLKAETATDSTLHPKLEDVNIGWLQKYRQDAPRAVLKEIAQGSNEIKVGAGGDYPNLDALVFDAKNTMIDPVFRARLDLVVLCNHDLLNDKFLTYYATADKNSEAVAADMLMLSHTIGGLPVFPVSQMPAGSILITPFKNLSLYLQLGSHRRTIIENPRRDCVENFESVNEAYVVEDYRAGCLIDNVKKV